MPGKELVPRRIRRIQTPCEEAMTKPNSPLIESVRTWVLQNLPYNQRNASLGVYLNGLDAHGLLVRYHNWSSRLVRPQRRTVVTSAAYQRNPLTSQRASDLAQIIDDIEQGRDLKKYLSRDVVRYVVKIPKGSRRDLDLMLNDWGVHHLHISTRLDADGFVDRRGPLGDHLLFCVFRSAKAYLIDIMQHGDWTRDHVLEVLAAEWPAEGIVHEIQGASALSYLPTEIERATLRKKHVNAEFEYGGKFFRPRGGLTTAGTTLKATMDSDRLLKALADFEDRMEREPDWLKREFLAHGVAYPAAPEFEFAIREDGAGIVETKAAVWMNVVDWFQSMQSA
jgi:hypothetical protein